MEGSRWAGARRASLLTMMVLVGCGSAQTTRLADATAGSSSTAVGLPTWSALPSPWVPSLSPTIAPTPTPAPTHAPPTNTPRGAPGTATPSPTSSGGGGGGTSVVFADNFSGNSVDTSKWLVQNGGRTSNNEMQCYLSANTSEGGGALTETVKVDHSCNNTGGGGGGGGYSSGAIQSHFTFTYGTVSVRAKFAGGGGPWPAIWLLGHNCQPWKATPTDASPTGRRPAAMRSTSPRSSTPTIHRSTGIHSSRQPELRTPRLLPTTSDTSQNWHTYKLDWAPGSLTWKIDGTTTCTAHAGAVPSQANVPDHQHGGRRHRRADPSTTERCPRPPRSPRRASPDRRAAVRPTGRMSRLHRDTRWGGLAAPHLTARMPIPPDPAGSYPEARCRRCQGDASGGERSRDVAGGRGRRGRVQCVDLSADPGGGRIRASEA